MRADEHYLVTWSIYTNKNEENLVVIINDDSVYPSMNTIASRDQFKPIKIGQNLVVNYNL